MSQLEELFLDENTISKLEKLENKKALVKLNISNNRIK